MNFFKKYTCLLIALSTLFFLACDKEELGAGGNGSSDDTIILKENAFGCQEYQSFQVAGDGQLVHSMHQYNNYFLYHFSTLDSNYLEIKNGIDVNTVLTEKMHVRKFFDYENKVLICSDNGIYELDEQLNLNLKVEEECRDIILTNNNQLLFIGQSLQDIKIYYPSIDFFEDYNTFSRDSELGYLGLFNGQGNTFWGITDLGELVLFEGPWIKEHYYDSNSSLHTHNWSTGDKYLFPFQYKGDQYFVESFSSEGQILMYNNDYFKILVDFSWDNEVEDWVDIRPLEFEEIMVKGDNLYIGTKRDGIIKCDLTKEGFWGMDNIQVFADPDLPSNWVSYLYAGKNGKVYIINDRKIVTEVDCF
ncbi:MAG: hypothetical protein AAFZ15_13955 [Bacteroidota bacterium]